MAQQLDSLTLASPIELPCGLQLPNRLAKAAMTEGLADGLSRPTPELCRLYETWSKGETGLLITGNVQVDRRYLERPGNVCIDGAQSDAQLKLLKQYAASGQKYNDSKIFVQLSHAGRQTIALVNKSPIAPSAVPLKIVPKSFIGKSTAMTLDDIQDVKQRFINAAKVCKDCGFDGIQVHAAHGYLLSSFMNPIANKRTDAYGGSLDNRCRLLLEIVSEIRRIVGPTYAISVKLNSADFQKGGFTADECIQVAKWLQDAGIDLLELSGGNYDAKGGIYHEFDVEGKETDLDEIIDKYNMKRSTVLREAYYVKYSRDVINALSRNNDKKHRMCIMCTGGFRSKEVMLKALNSNGCDVIGIARPLCGKPDAVRELISSTDANYSLPRYEGTLVVGLPFIHRYLIGNRSVQKHIQILSAIDTMGKQSWYYIQMIGLGTTGKTNQNIGCFSALIANGKHDEKCAANLIGICAVGSVYNKNGSVNNPPMVVVPRKYTPIWMKLIVSCCVVGLSVLSYKYYY
eukprot:265656_1